MIASLILTLIHVVGGAEIKFDLGARDTLLIAFFTTVGLSAQVRLLAAGGAMLVILTVVAVVNLVIQDLVGVAEARPIG